MSVHRQMLRAAWYRKEGNRNIEQFSYVDERLFFLREQAILLAAMLQNASRSLVAGRTVFSVITCRAPSAGYKVLRYSRNWICQLALFAIELR